MKNNTKLIMETWRRFLAEGPDAPMYDPEEGEPTGDPIDPSEETELSGDVPQRNNLPFDDKYNSSGALDVDLGDPSIQTGPAPMLDAPDEERDDVDSYDSYDMRKDKYLADNDYDETTFDEEPQPMTAEEKIKAFEERQGGSIDDYDSAAAQEELSGFDDPMDDY